jgi:RNA polymerase sigma-70 factor (ECF subfamily)
LGPEICSDSAEIPAHSCRKVSAPIVYMDMQSFEDHSEQPDDHLIRAVLAGNRDAYADLVRRYGRQVHAAAWAILRNHQAAEDLTQETFIKAYDKLTTLRAPGGFGPWLLTIVRRKATDCARRKRRLVFVPTVPDMQWLDVPAEEDAALVLSALARIPDREQQVVLLRYFDDLAVADIAALLGRPVGTVTKQLSRALTRLRNLLKETS